jgi:putative membrane protein
MMQPVNQSRTRLNARAASAVCTVAAAAAFLAACDNREQQKPKVAGFEITGLIASASAQQVDRVVPPAAISGKLAPVDEAFALYAASSGLAEIEGAQLVLKSTKRNELRDYAERLVREHQKSLDSLRRIVAPRGLALPSASTGRHADMVTKLGGLSAADREEAFLTRFGIDAHKEILALFERQAEEGKEAQLKRYAQQTVPILREHMAAAQKLIHAESTSR